MSLINIIVHNFVSVKMDLFENWIDAIKNSLSIYHEI